MSKIKRVDVKASMLVGRNCGQQPGHFAYTQMCLQPRQE